MSINSYSPEEYRQRVELDTLKIHEISKSFNHSTGFNTSDEKTSRNTVHLLDQGSSHSDFSSSMESSTEWEEEHRHLSQSIASLSTYTSLSSSCSSSSSDLSYDTLEDNSSYRSTETEDMERSSYLYYSEDSSVYDYHLKLIQLDSNGGDDDEDCAESSPDNKQKQDLVSDEEKRAFCVQCHAWPEVEENTDLPRKFCHHTTTDVFESAFGRSVYISSTRSLNYADETSAAIAKKKAMETILKTQFHLLIQQFAANPENVARKLYGISVIDINDLNVATSHTVSQLDRARVLMVTLVRRLRHDPGLFEDVCKVLCDIPAIQEASARARQLFYEECSDDQYSKLLAENAQHHQNSPESVYYSVTDLTTVDEDITHDIITEDSVSHCSKISDENHNSPVSHGTHENVSHDDTHEYHTSPDPHDVSSMSDSSCQVFHRRKNMLLHKSCLENRSTRSLDALIGEQEIDINSRDQNGRTPLMIACLCLPADNPDERISFKQRKKIRCLLENGADVTIQDYDGNTALHIAVLRRDAEVLKSLLNKAQLKENFNIATTNKNSRTALHYACYWGDRELIFPLLELEKNLNIGLLNVRDRNGDTVLHISSRRGFKMIVKELLKANVNKDIINKEGKTAADEAREAKHNGIAKLMRTKKSRWHFNRKKSSAPSAAAAVATESIDSGLMKRSCSCSSLVSDDGSNHSDEIFPLSEDSDVEEAEM